MDLVTGALGKLSSKLLELLHKEYKLQMGAWLEVESCSRELDSMHAALRKVAAVPWHQLDEQVKIWAREVKEASYDMEDVLDTFLVHVDSCRETTDVGMLKRAINKMSDLLRKGKARRDVAAAIEDIKKQLKEVTERRVRYKVDDLLVKPANATSIDPRLSALYAKVTELVGIHEPRDRIIEMLTERDGNVCIKETKIVCIVGPGGLGKTTLAKAVYENLTNNVDVKAFVPVGQNPDLKKVLKDILISLDKHRYTTISNLTMLDERQLIDELREFLKLKRFFIVIDDIWDVPSWNIIKYALGDNSLGSKIVITSRKHDVAKKAGCSYNMKPLPYESCKVLFYGRIFGSEEKCPKEFVEVSEKIIKKCGGVPLAIITTSSLLATNKLGNIKEWSELCDSIGLGLGSNHDMEDMRKILSLSYYDLPSHLKTCLLYISVFPEDYEVRKSRLIWRWIAEDFVPHGEGGQSVIETAESYFNEFINRNLIQPSQIDEEGLPDTFRVHDMVHDLICSLSREESFVATVLGDTKKNAYSWQGKVRRLSLHNATWPVMDMSKLRSLTIFNRGKINSMPSLLCQHHLLRTLDLEGCNLKDHRSLSFVGNLFHLRYLGLRDTRYAGELPAEIGKLQFLQTLNLLETYTEELPSSIVRLRQLMCLHVNWIIRLPNRLRNLTALEEIWCATVDSADIAEELGHLTQLKTLTVELIIMGKEGGCDDNLCNALVGSLGKLQKIQRLVIFSYDVACNLECPMESSLGNLRYLRIRRTSLLPTWINPGSLLLLSFMDIALAEVRREDIQVLGMLRALCNLEVSVPGDIQGLGKYMVGPDAFPCVTVCRFEGFSTVPTMFPPGAMPRLKKFEFCLRLEDFAGGEFIADDLAIGHLPSLERVAVYVYGNGKEEANKEVVIKVKEKLRQEEDVHPNHPSIITHVRYK